MKKYIIILLTLFLIFTGKVYATTTYTCDKTVKQGENITCKVTFDTEDAVLEASNKLKISSVNASMYEKLGDSKIIFKSSGTVTFTPLDNTVGTYSFSLLDEEGNKLGDNISTTVIEEKKSTNNYIKTIKINNEELVGFEKNKQNYTYTVDSSVTKADIKVETEDEKANVHITGPDELKEGDNKYTIEVTSENGDTRSYYITITMEKSSNTKIKSIEIKNYELNFDGVSKTYYLKIKEKDTKLKIDIELEDEKSTYEIDGNESLKNGSVIKIKVIAEDKEEDTYRIIIEKEVKKEKKNIIPFIIGGIFIVVVIVIIIIMIKKKNNKNKPTKEEKNIIEEDKTKVYSDTEPTKEVILNEIDNDEDELTKTLVFDKDLNVDKSIDDEFNNL